MDIDCENRCGDRKKKGVNLMTGAELKKVIDENNLDDIEFYYATDDCTCSGGRMVSAIDIRIYSQDIQKHIEDKNHGKIVVLK